MTLRKARNRVSDAQLKKLHDFLFALIPVTAIDSYFAHWPPHLKEKMNREFVDRLNDAEREYTECDADGEAVRVPMLLGKNVFDLLDLREIHDSTVKSVLGVVMSELEGMRMNELIHAMKQIDR